MDNHSTSRNSHSLPGFNAHAVAIAKRQYFQPGEETVGAMFRRVASWVAQAEPAELRADATETFYQLMADQRFCPGGRVLAGAATTHGNVLNCFVQDGRPDQAGTDAWVMTLAGKLAAVTKVGGGNGVNLDPIGPKREFSGRSGRLYITADAAHPDYSKIASGTFLDLVRGETITRGYRSATFVEPGAAPKDATHIRVLDS
ncbi:MAG TPA: ribonucleotide reductase N-terminal alpha domain-containing protein, partial [Trueperaceae bacterium]|nr:ribonucleotide reductase N-terminal alpha domain-containing protein [Trueperaceae bacterium]